jgi:hypothetical protein
MFFELQLSSAIFGRVVRNRLRAQRLCVDQELAVAGAQLVVDRIEVKDETTIHREAGSSQQVAIFSRHGYPQLAVPFLQVRQLLTIHLVTADALEQSGPAPTPPVQSADVHVLINVALNAQNQTQGGGPLSMSYALGAIDYGAAGPLIPESAKAMIEQKVRGLVPAPTKLAMPKLPFGQNGQAVNAGIMCDTAGSCVALRVDFDLAYISDNPSLDRAFFTEGPVNRLDGRDWSLLLDAQLLLGQIRKTVTDTLNSQARVVLRSGPAVGWEPSGPSLHATARIEILDACPFFVDVIDMDVDVDVRATVSVPADGSPRGTLRNTLTITGEPSDVAEVVGCAVTGSLVWPVTGFKLLDDEHSGVGLAGAIAMAALGPLGTLIGVIVSIENTTADIDPTQLGANCSKLDDEHYQCDMPFVADMRLIPPVTSTLKLEAARGITEGLVLGGTITRLVDLPPDDLRVDVTPLDWTPAGGCKDGFTIVSSGSIDVTSNRDDAVCSVRVLSADPFGAYPPPVVDGNSVSIRANVTDAFLAAPYPCVVRLVTAGGVRTLTVAAPTAITADKQAHVERLIRNFEKTCAIVRETDSLPVGWRPGDRVRIRDIVHPGGLEDPGWAFWQLALRGAREDATVVVQRPDGAAVMTARSSQAGVVHVTTIFAGEDQPDALTLVVEGGPVATDVRVSGMQVRFDHRGSVTVAGAVRSLAFAPGATGLQLLVSDDVQDAVWDVSTTYAPALLSAVAREEATHGDVAFSVLHTGRRIDGADAERVALARSLAGDHRIAAIGAPRVGGVARPLYVRTDEGARLYDASGPDEPRLMQTYAGPAWFEGTALGRRVMARHDPEAGVINLYAAGELVEV